MLHHNAAFTGIIYPHKGRVNRPEHGAVSTSSTVEHFSDEPGVNILAIDGGGMRGLFALACLSTIAETLYGDSDTAGTQKLMKNFDLVCGTSTGGIIATGLATGHSIQEIRTMYLKMGGDVFSSRWYYGPARLFRCV